MYRKWKLDWSVINDKEILSKRNKMINPKCAEFKKLQQNVIDAGNKADRASMNLREHSKWKDK
jgi:hypothetical protein